MGKIGLISVILAAVVFSSAARAEGACVDSRSVPSIAPAVALTTLLAPSPTANNEG